MVIKGGIYHRLNHKKAYNKMKALLIESVSVITYKFWNNPGIFPKTQKNTPKSKFRRIASMVYMGYQNL